MLKAAFTGAASVALIIAACSPFGGASVFHCDEDSQCSPGGSCKQPEGLCAFPNAACPTGEAYGEHAGGMSGQCVGGGDPADAGVDAPTMCTPNEKTCFQHAIETCRADGDGFDPALREACALTCNTGGTPTCSAASNISLDDQRDCDANAPALAPPAGATVTINATSITCSPECNAAGATMIARTNPGPNNFYCVSAINIPAGVTVTAAPNITGGVTLFSHGAVVINADIVFDGGNATGVLNDLTLDDLAGTAGPGGFPGAGPSADNGAGLNGPGPAGTQCGGRGGGTGGANAARAGGGGGGGGNQSDGGIGGDGRTAQNTVVNGGGAGTTTGCSTPELRPLVGGAGGGSGGDGACGPDNNCGWPGGGGGGALHVVSRTMISGSGVLSASGGAGFGLAVEPGGGGGGGAGGGILLEAPSVTLTGPLRVHGGNGGRATAIANGGAGGAGGTPGGTDGGDAVAASQSGAGGGGGGGRIRINATNASCANASPAASCTTGTLRSEP